MNRSRIVITRVGLLYPIEERRKKPVIRPKIQRKSTQSVVTSLIITYFKKSSIHGLKHLVNPHHNWLQRVFTATMILICLLFAVKNIATSIDIYQKAITSPFIKSDTISTSKIPFPGVAICNRNGVKKSALIALANRMKDNANMSFAETYQTLEHLGNLRDVLNIPHLERELLKFILDKNEQSHNLTAIITEVSQSCDDMIKTCYYEEAPVPCRSLFRTAITPGYRSCCVMFNAAILQTSKRQRGPLLLLRKTQYTYDGFLFTLDLQTSEYTSSSNGIYGAEVMIFDPRSHPVRNGNSLVISAGHGEATFLELNPEVESVSTLRACKIHFDNHTIKQDLPFSLPECIFRCQTVLLANKCKCYQYHRDDYEQYRECTIDGLECNSRVLQRGENFEMLLDSDLDMADKAHFECISKCKSFPACNSTTHSVNSYNVLQPKSSRAANETNVFVYYGPHFAIEYERRPIYTFEQLIVQIIGQLSLFLGASCTSIVELIYFFTLRLFCDLYSNQLLEKDEKETEPEKTCDKEREENMRKDKILPAID